MANAYDTYGVYADWDKNGLFCFDARPAHIPSLLPATVADLTTLKRDFSIDLLTDVSELPLATSVKQFVLPLGVSDATYRIGFDGTNSDLVVAAGTYTAQIYLTRNTFATITNVQLIDDGVVIATSSTNTSNGYVVTGTVSGAGSKLYVAITGRRSGPGYIRVDGLMIFPGSTAQPFNCGTPSMYENLTGDVMQLSCVHGFDQPYEQVAPMAECTIQLDNVSKRYSPEYTSGPLYGSLKTGVFVFVAGVAGSYGIWAGWIEKISPTPGTARDTMCEMKSNGVLRYYQGLKVFPALKTDITISDAVDYVNELVSAPALGVAIGRSFTSLVSAADTRLGLVSIAESYGGLNTIGNAPYYFDADEEGTDAAKLLGYMMMGVAGKLWFEPSFQTVINVNPAWTEYNFGILMGLYGGVNGNSSTPLATIGDTGAGGWVDCRYDYGETIVNEATAKAWRRKASASTTVKLWELNETIVLASGESVELKAEYRNEDTGKVWGAVPSTVALVITAGTGISSSIDARAKSTIITLINNARGTRSVTAASLTGQRLVAFQPIESSVSNIDSIADHGTMGITITSKWISRPNDALNLAGHWVGQLAYTRGEMRYVDVVYQAGYELSPFASTFRDLRVGDIIAVNDGQTGHDAKYVIIGIGHEMSDSLAWHVIRFYLERLGDVGVVDVMDVVTDEDDTSVMVGMY